MPICCCTSSMRPARSVTSRSRPSIRCCGISMPMKFRRSWSITKSMRRAMTRGSSETNMVRLRESSSAPCNAAGSTVCGNRSLNLVRSQRETMRLMKLFNLNDPGWGRGNQNQNDDTRQKPDQSSGPPDLDEVWRDFSKRLNGVFGRRGGGRGGRPPAGGGMPSLPGPSPRFLALLAVVAVLLWLASGFMIVQEGQVAVVTRFGQYVKTLKPGLQWRLPYPIEASQSVNISQLRTFEVGFRGSSRNKTLSESLMLTNDENIVDVQFVVQYRLLPDGAPAYLFNTSQPDESVRQAAETAMREIVGRKPMDFVLYSGRTEVASEVHALAQ